MIELLAALAGWACAQGAPYRYATQERFANVEVSFTLDAGAAASADGVHIGLRRRAPSYLYDIALRGNRAAIRKELPGPSGASFYELAAPVEDPSLAAQESVRATAVDQPGGAVRISLYAGGRLVATALDDGSIAGPPIQGAGDVVLTGSDAGAPFEDLSIAALAGAQAAPLDAVPDSAAKAPQKFLSPARADGVNDAAFFGSGAARVTIYDLRGRKVYQAAGSGGLRWDGRDEDGRLVPSGVYVARIVKTDGHRCYQSFAVVK